jgi:hypothetical protein
VKKMTHKRENNEQADQIPFRNPLRERLTDMETADFGSATLRRIALLHTSGHKNKY